MIINDPVYLTEPYVNSQEFALMERGNQNWLYNCEYLMEVPMDQTKVPHFLPGAAPFAADYSKKFGLPLTAVWGGAESTYPEYVAKLASNAPLTVPRDPPPAARTRPPDIRNEIETIHVQGNVYMLVGAGANVAVQIGDEGVLVVDTGAAAAREKLLAAIRKLSTKPIRWIINTNPDVDHTGGNEAISQAGQTVNGNPADLVAHEGTLARMTEMNRSITERPLKTYYEEGRDFSFNGEAVMLYHPADAHTGGDSIVYFRGSDVLVAGDIFLTTTFPFIDEQAGGGVNGLLNGLNKMLAIAVPKYLQEGGTYVIPGHGRIGDEADIVEYRDMVVIVRDRIQDMVKKGMTLDQVKAARPTLDYDLRYGAESATRFVEAVYRILSAKK
jgi:glyoxylase-like metal-dependent hydrolase (beta-lactamase superfamily II)